MKKIKPQVVVDSSKDVLATVDVYAKDAKGSPVNDLPKNNGSLFKGMGDKVSNIGVLSDIKQNVVKEPNVFLKLTNALDTKDRIDSLFSKGTNYTKNADALNQIGSLVGLSPEADIGEIVVGASRFMTKDTRNASDLVRLANTVLGSDIIKVVDTKGFGSIVSGLIKQAQSLGLIDLANVILNEINDKELKKKAYEDSFESLVVMGDYEEVKKAIDVIGIAKAKRLVPDFCKVFITGYIDRRKPKDKSNTTKNRERREGVENLLAKFDKEWDLETINGVKRPSIRNTRTASRDWCSMYRSQMAANVESNAPPFVFNTPFERRALLALLANKIREVPFEQLIRRQYPKTKFTVR